jgi:hypothetical protein
MMPAERFESRTRISGILIAAGLLVQSATHFWVHPLAFLTFLIIGAPLVAIGVFTFLYSLLMERN